jgi:hypothetical protein
LVGPWVWGGAGGRGRGEHRGGVGRGGAGRGWGGRAADRSGLADRRRAAGRTGRGPHGPRAARAAGRTGRASLRPCRVLRALPAAGGRLGAGPDPPPPPRVGGPPGRAGLGRGLDRPGVMGGVISESAGALPRLQRGCRACIPCVHGGRGARPAQGVWRGSRRCCQPGRPACGACSPSRGAADWAHIPSCLRHVGRMGPPPIIHPSLIGCIPHPAYGTGLRAGRDIIGPGAASFPLLTTCVRGRNITSRYMPLLRP